MTSGRKTRHHYNGDGCFSLWEKTKNKESEGEKTKTKMIRVEKLPKYYNNKDYRYPSHHCNEVEKPQMKLP